MRPTHATANSTSTPRPRNGTLDWRTAGEDAGVVGAQGGGGAAEWVVAMASLSPAGFSLTTDAQPGVAGTRGTSGEEAPPLFELPLACELGFLPS